MNLLSNLLTASKTFLVVGLLTLPSSAAQAQDATDISASHKTLFKKNSNQFQSSSVANATAQKGVAQAARGQQDTAHQFHTVKPWNPGNGWTAWPNPGISFNNPTRQAKAVAAPKAQQQKTVATPHSFERPQEAWAYQDNYHNQSSTAASATVHGSETDAYGSVIKK